MSVQRFILCVFLLTSAAGPALAEEDKNAGVGGPVAISGFKGLTSDSLILLIARPGEGGRGPTRLAADMDIPVLPGTLTAPGADDNMVQRGLAYLKGKGSRFLKR